MSLNGFEEADQQALIPTVPQSSNESKVVRLGAKVLETKKEMRKVLTEEIYVDNMQKIIVRDYFPELPKLKAQAEYLDAVARNDQAKIRELQVRYSTKRTDRRTSPSARPKTPKAFDATTPGPSGSGGTDLPFSNIEGDNASVDAKKKKKKVIDNLSLQKYMDSYTSEDNASFEELAEIHQRRELIKNAWMYDAEEKHNKQLVYRTTRAVLPADESAIAIRDRERERPNDIDNWEYKARNPVLFHPEDAPLTVEEHIQIMKQNEKIINKEATRLNEKTIQQPHQSSMARAAMHHAVVNSGLVDISGKDLGIVSASTLGCVATPTPMPGVAESPLMTWGEIEGTPFRLDGADIASTVSDDAPAFKIPEVPLRERIAQEISDTIARRYRDKRKFAMEHVEKMHAKTPKFGSVRSTDKLAIMSPAARRLANNKLGIRIGTDKFLKSTYSPRKTPGSTRSTIYSPAIHKYVKVKKEVKEELRSNPPSAPSTPREYVTDDLLHLPSPTAPPVVDPSARPSASDFF